jgi:hypothetical protein
MKADIVYSDYNKTNVARNNKRVQDKVQHESITT